MSAGWSSPLWLPTYLSSDQLQQGAVDGQQVDVGADGRLVEGAGLAVQLVEAGLAHGVRAAQADGLVAAAVKLIVADGARQELRPLSRLHRHPAATPQREAPPSSGGIHASDTPTAAPAGQCRRRL